MRSAGRDASPGPAPADPPISLVPVRTAMDERALRRRDRKLALVLMAGSALLVLLGLAALAWLLLRST